MADYQTTHCLWFMHLNVVNSKHTTRNTTAKFFSCFDRKRKLIFFKSFGYVRISTYSYPTGLVNSGVNYMLRKTFTNWYTHKKNWIVYILRTKYTKKKDIGIFKRCVLDAILYVIKFVIDWRQVGGFLRVLRFPPPVKLTATI